MPRGHRRRPCRLLAQSAVDVRDEVIQLYDQALSGRESPARDKLADQLRERTQRSENKLALAEAILPVLADPATPDEELGGLLRNRIGMTPVARDARRTGDRTVAARPWTTGRARILLQLPGALHSAGPRCAGRDRLAVWNRSVVTEFDEHTQC